MTSFIKYSRGLSLLLLLLAQNVFAEPEDDLVTLNLNNADISAFITDIGQITGKTVIVDPRVKGSVTIISTHPMTKDEVYQVFISTLEVHGFTAVEGNGVIKVVPVSDVKQDVMKFTTASKPGVGDEYVTRVIQLDQVSAQEILPLVKPLSAKFGHIAAYAPSNVLIVVDRASNVQRIAKLVNQVDKASNEDVEIIPLAYASATDIVKMLTKLTKVSAGKKEVPERVTKYVADKRTNSILLSGEKAARLRIRTVITQLDTPLNSDTGNIKVVYLHNAKASELVTVLNGVIGTIEQQVRAVKKAEGKSTVSASLNQVVSKTSIQADDSTNSLLIASPPDVMRSLEAVIKQLDIRRAQVLVEAIIVELSDERREELGIQWLFGSAHANGVSTFPGAGAAINPAAITDSVVDTLSTSSGLNLGLGTLGKASGFGAVLHALSTGDGANILSTPSIITMDNQEASIVVGQEVPFITGSTTGDNNSNPFTTVTREKIGIKLEITPQINEGDAVRLKIYQEVSSVSPTQGATDVITNQREITTTVLVNDGATVVLGGLISEESNEGENKVPVLGDIPILGNLFKSTITEKDRRNLLVFIRPIIIRDEQRLDEISGQKYSYIREQQLALQEQGIALMPDETIAVLPAWDSSEILPWRIAE